MINIASMLRLPKALLQSSNKGGLSKKTLLPLQSSSMSSSMSTTGSGGDDNDSKDETKPTDDTTKTSSFWKNNKGGKKSKNSLEELQKIFAEDLRPTDKILQLIDESVREKKALDPSFVDDRLEIERPEGQHLLSDNGGWSREKSSTPNIGANLMDGDIYQPDDLNWMQPSKFEDDDPMNRKVKETPAKHFRAADQDPLELALNPDLLRLFISPTGRIQPRRFTGLTMKEQRQLKRAVKTSQNLAMLPYLSRYPAPSKEQLNVMAESMQFAKFEMDKVEKTMVEVDED